MQCVADLLKECVECSDLVTGDCEADGRGAQQTSARRRLFFVPVAYRMACKKESKDLQCVSSERKSTSISVAIEEETEEGLSKTRSTPCFFTDRSAYADERVTDYSRGSSHRPLATERHSKVPKQSCSDRKARRDRTQVATRSCDSVYNLRTPTNPRFIPTPTCTRAKPSLVLNLHTHRRHCLNALLTLGHLIFAFFKQTSSEFGTLTVPAGLRFSGTGQAPKGVAYGKSYV
eukprot:1177978-Prorocentrum_minimum.AAC.1